MLCLWILFTISSCMMYPLPEKKIVIKDFTDSRMEEIRKGLFEGDIFLPKYRSGVRSSVFRWPNGVVPYIFSNAFTRTMRNNIINAMREIESNTKSDGMNCIKFVEWTNEPDYIYIQNNIGCYSQIGRYGGAQVLSLGQGCEFKGTAMHEMIHALGFWHEQNRYDRDEFIKVHTDNIMTSRLYNFKLRTRFEMDLLGTAYDMGSIMHYGPYVFATNRSHPSLSPKSAKSAMGVKMGQRDGMSKLDVERIQRLYGCPVDTSHIATLKIIVHCSFETVCDLQQDTDDDFDWIYQNPGTPTYGTRLNTDSTNGIGTYIYAEAKEHHGKRARLLTKMIDSGRYCIKIGTFQHSSQNGALDIIAGEANMKEQTIVTIFGKQSAWKEHIYYLIAPSMFRVILQARIGNGDSSDIAIDDFTIYRGECK